MKVNIVKPKNINEVEMTILELSKTNMCIGVLQCDGLSKYMLCEGPVVHHESIKFMFMRPRYNRGNKIWSWSSSLIDLLINAGPNVQFYVFETQDDLFKWMLEKK